MNREIKYRGKSNHGNMWYYGHYYNDGAKDFINKPFEPLCLIDPETVGQYTGLKDANGVEIYEGDRLHCTDEERDLEWTTVVRYQDTAFVIDIENEEYNVTSIGFINFDYTKLEVIGNIHTNE